MSLYTEWYWKIDLHNLLHFLHLRMDVHAQWEIRQYALTIGEEIVHPLFPLVWEAFEDYRVAAMQYHISPPGQVGQALDQAGYPVGNGQLPSGPSAGPKAKDPAWDALGVRVTKTNQTDLEMSGEFRMY